MRKKVLFFSSLYYPQVIGGAEKVAQMLAEQLSLHDFDVAVVTTCDQAAKDEVVDTINAINVYRLKIENIYYPFNSNEDHSILAKAWWHLKDLNNKEMAAKIRKIIAAVKPDLICTHSLTGISDCVWRLAKKEFNLPVVHVLHDHYQLCPWATMYRNKRSCKKQCFICKVASWKKKLLTKYVDALVGVSNYILQRHLEYGYFNAAVLKKVIYNAVNPANLLTTALTVNNSGKLRLGFIGRVEFVKGIETLLQAMQSFDPGKVELYIAGRAESGYLSKLQAKYFQDNIKYLGFVAPTALYEKIDLLVMPSQLPEAFPLVTLEALANSIPVIGSNSGGIPEIIRENINGFLFEPGDVATLIALINRFLVDPILLAKLKNNKFLSLEQFNLNWQANAYIELFHSLWNRT